MTRRTCGKCRRPTQSIRGRASGQCGPCWMGLPIGWWDDFDEVTGRVCGLPRPASAPQENDDD